MPDPNEINPNKTTAPGSDNTQGGGGASSTPGATPTPPPPPPPQFDKGMSDKIKKQVEEQEKQTKLLDEVVKQLMEQEKNLLDAQKKMHDAQEKSDEEAFKLAEKDYYVALKFQNRSDQQFIDLSRVIKEMQDKIDEDLLILVDDAKVDSAKGIKLAQEHVGIDKDGRQNADEHYKSLEEANQESRSDFKKFSDDFALQSAAEKELEDRRTKSLEDAIVASKPEGAVDLASVMQKTSLNLESLALVQERMNDEIKSAEESGTLDVTDQKAVERFKMQMSESKSFKDSIVKELIKSRESLKEETVQKELQEQYLRMGIPASVASIKAEREAKAETDKKRKEYNEQIRVMRGIEKGQLFTANLIQDDVRRKIEKEKEEAGLPKWYLDYKKSTAMTNALLGELVDSFNSGGWMKKVFMILAVIAGVVVGFIAESLRKIISLVKIGGGVIGGFFKYLTEASPILRTLIEYFGKFTAAIGRVFNTFKEGTAVGKFLFNMFGKVGSMVSGVVNTIKSVINSLRFVATAGKEAGFLINFLGSIIKPVMQVFQAFGVGLKIGAGLFKLLGKIFVPISIALTVIDGVIGAFKGFKKEGLAGLIPGVLSGILSGLTLGFVKFDTIYKWVKKLFDFMLWPIYTLVEYFKFIMTAVQNIWSLIKDIFSGKGIKNAFSVFFLRMTKAFIELLENIYDMTIGAFLRLFGFGEEKVKDGNKETETLIDKVWNFLKMFNPIGWILKGVSGIFSGIMSLFGAGEEKGKEAKEEGEGILSKVFGVLKYLNPLHWIKKGIESLLSSVKDVFSKLDAFLGNLMSKVFVFINDILGNFFGKIKSAFTKIVTKFFMFFDNIFDLIFRIIPNAIKKVFQKVTDIVLGILDIVGFPIKILSGFYKKVYNLVMGMLDKIFGVIDSIISVPYRFAYKIHQTIQLAMDEMFKHAENLIRMPIEFLSNVSKSIIGVLDEIHKVLMKIIRLPIDFLNEVYKTLKDMFDRVLNTIKKIAAIPVNILDRLLKMILAFIEKAVSFLPWGLDSYFKPVEDLTKLSSLGGGGGGSSIQKGAGAEGEDLSTVQKNRDIAAEAKESSNGGTNVSTTNNVVSGGGGKTPPPTIIAPQPPRNSEPTVRAMQFGESPAF